MADENNYQDEFEKYRDNVSTEDIENILNKESQINKSLKSSNKLMTHISDVKYMFYLVKDFSTGKYKNVPWKVIASIVGSLVYLVSPIDAVTDVIPIFGLLDDAAVIGICLKLISEDLSEYISWKKSNQDEKSKIE